MKHTTRHNRLLSPGATLTIFTLLLVTVYTTTTTTQHTNTTILRYPIHTHNNTHTYTHCVQDSRTGILYLAGDNIIIQLGPDDLREQARALTGPLPDDPACHASGCDEARSAPLLDNINKILVLVEESTQGQGQGSLIACGSVAQGACRKYKLGDIAGRSQFLAVPVAATSEDASTFAFVGPERYKTWGASQVLYVGTTFTLRGDYRHDVPAIATRNLHTLEVAEYSFSKQSYVQIDVKYRDNFLVRYVYGFNASDYAYFVVVQKKSHLAGEEKYGHNTRLARVCVNDDNYDSYAEVTLRCTGEDGADYNLAADAELYSPGGDNGEAILFVTFNPSAGIEDKPGPDSAVCSFSIAEIEAKFDENIHMCFNGTVLSRNLGYVSGMISEGDCPAAGATGNIVDFCDVGLKISGSLPLAVTALITFPGSRVTAIATANAGGRPVLFLGTVDGRLKKVAIGNGRGRQYADVDLAPGEKVLPDTVLAVGGKSVLVLTEKTLFSVPVENCSAHHDCSG